MIEALFIGVPVGGGDYEEDDDEYDDEYDDEDVDNYGQQGEGEARVTKGRSSIRTKAEISLLMIGVSPQSHG